MRHCFPSLTLTLTMADPSLASTAVFGSATIKWSEINWRPSDAGRKLGEKLLSQKHEFKNAIQRPNSATIWISGVSTARQVDHQGISNRSPSPLDLGCPRSTSSYQ